MRNFSTKSLFLLLTTIFCLTAADSLQAQPQKVGTSNSYTSIEADTSLLGHKHLGYRYFGDATTFTIGVHYTKGASEDTLSTVEVYHALTEDVLTAELGKKVSNDTLLQFDHPGAAEYKEQTITLTGKVGYIDIWYDRASTATDTFTVAPRIFIKPK